jgi:hypothetical protein
MALASHAKVDIFDTRAGLSNFDRLVRANMEGFFLHTWYCDVWDVASTDDTTWNARVLARIKVFVEEDRKLLTVTENRQVSALYVIHHYLIIVKRTFCAFWTFVALSCRSFSRTAGKAKSKRMRSSCCLPSKFMSSAA